MENVNFEGQVVDPNPDQNQSQNLNPNSNQNEAPKAPKNKKLIWAGVVLAALILAVIGWQYWQYTQSPYYQQMKAVKAIEKDLKEQDKWGGKTPEETVRLFTEAVKNGDFDLASRYGVSSLQSEIKNTLNDYKNSEYWDDYLVWLENLKKNTDSNQNFGPDSITYESFDAKGRRVVFISLAKSDGGTWKINEF